MCVCVEASHRDESSRQEKMGDRNSPSIGALTCSLDDRCAKYWSDVSVHRDGTEMTDGIYRMFVSGLREYLKRNQKAPTRIFFYRDGVGEGQIVQVNSFMHFLFSFFYAKMQEY